MRVKVEGVSCKHGPKMETSFPCAGSWPYTLWENSVVKRLLESGEDMIEGAPENIIWCYGIYQPAYDEMRRNIPNITFVKRSSQ